MIQYGLNVNKMMKKKKNLEHLAVTRHDLHCVFICCILCRVSAPEQVFLPIANWQPKENPVLEDDIGPLVQHIYEVENAVKIISQRNYTFIKLQQCIISEFFFFFLL